ncbi:magnesium/cobalt transporter CorA [Adhaeribacter pallidiroseus]|uniref:Magnesium transport protein CorA n=1 Tax=Adhaeribacter pallidiroseus TaxID=2072847 RepID=A0A369QMV7_9BACT|nr:magnesium/cobalt transporter CorA [Adhaeribacter pallidiroseus]RDC63538.1 Magnesium transport protein CorA [Adhaeribacter pallidiroseus]
MKVFRSLTKSKALQENTFDKKVGQRPGYLYVPDNAHQPRMFLISFDEDQIQEKEYQDYDQLLHYFKTNPQQQHWIDIRGYGNIALLEKIMADFTIHPLQMEDVISDYQRPKMDTEGKNLFFISRMIMFLPDHCLDDDQISIFTGVNYIITFQSDYEDCLDVLRNRIRSGKGIIRQRPVQYMAYAIMDVTIDNYFPVLSAVGEYLEELEDALFDHPTKKQLNSILNMKRELLKVRRIAWSERDKLNEILRSDNNTIPDEIKIYFKDVYDHVVQVLDIVDNYRELMGNLTELYLSNVSNRMNEIMKVLTIISSIFIPLSFVAGVYGMNFSRENPDGTINYLNMPELYHPYGYVILLAVMFLILIGQLYFFYRKGWLRSF